ncbi:unnamed protein product [Rhizophagus irregularis]|uniref:Uncharacterized protein n=1 Tax=Rhizophagus irregularis TaxID=588596 RepID=A0A915Z4G2_9GLOM|nr:unnamed protein product [Rhizophagus irregularis]
MSLSLDDATTSNDPMSIGSSFVNEEISIDPQESISSSENLSTFSSKRRKRSRFRLADTAIDTLIKFIKHILTNFNYDRFKDFPTSLYTARKKLGLKHQFVKFSVCPSCHKLHNIDDVKQHTIQQHKAIKKCGHVQFPNHHSLRQCNAPLSEQKELDDGKVVNAPLLIYPMPSIKEQLLQMYQRPNFEKNLKLWADRSVNDRVLCDD